MEPFDRQIAKFTAKTFDGFNVAYRKEVFSLYRNIVAGTPRDTGTLKMNWFFGRELTSTTLPAGDYPEGAVTAKVAGVIQDTQTVKITDTVFIYNNLEYAEAVEKGYGKGTRIARRMVAKAIELAKGKLSVTGG